MTTKPQASQMPYLVFLGPALYVIGIASASIVYHYSPGVSQGILAVLLCTGIVREAWAIVREAMHGRFGVDVLALVAMVASLWLQQWIAGSVILLMLSGGQALEAFASRRARRDLSALFARMPQVAHRKKGVRLSDISVDDVVTGDVLVVKPGEIVPVDGVIARGESTFDEALLTGESLASEKSVHDHVLGGSINQGGLVEMRATVTAEMSQYRRMVALVHDAEKQRAPIVRLADRYSIAFTAVSFCIAGVAWFVTQDPARALAVFVVATPCPLILATPIALLSGMSRSAGRGIIMKNGGAIEVLSRVTACVFDKTGTLTYGVPSIQNILSFGAPKEDVLLYAASLDQCSAHVLGHALTTYAAEKKIALRFPEHFEEVVGKGVSGQFDADVYRFGRLHFLEEVGVMCPSSLRVEDEKRRQQGMRTVYLAHDRKIIGGVVFADTIRPGMGRFFESLSHMGISRVEMLTGDTQHVAEQIAKEIGIRRVIAECLPEDKVKELARLKKTYTVAMVGDGMNDAPALAASDVGIAMGAAGAAIAAESADVVIAVDDVTRVRDALVISRDTIHIAKIGIAIGIGLSIGLMGVAAFGYLPPVYGAIAQEAVDVVVILNALRVPRIRHA